MRQYAEANKIHDIFFCGDLFHTHETVRTEVLDAACESFGEFSRNVTLHFLVGNHDMATRTGNIHALKFLSYMPEIMVIDEPMNFITGDNLYVSACPYTEDENLLKWFLNAADEDSIILMHQGVSGVEVNAKGFTVRGEILDPSMIPDNTYAFSGHYHSHKDVSDKLIIPGSLTQLTWNDKGEDRGWLDVTYHANENTIEVKHIDSGAPRFVELPGPEKVEGNFVKVRGDRELFDQIVKEGKAESVEFVLDFEESAPRMDSKKEFSSVSDMFDEFVEAREVSEERVKVGRELIDGTYEANIPNSQ